MLFRKVVYEVWIRKGETGGVFTPGGQGHPFIEDFGEACAHAKACIDEGADEAVVILRRVVKRFEKDVTVN